MASEWDVVDEKPVSQWDVVSTEPAGLPRTGAAQIPGYDEKRAAPTPGAKDTEPGFLHKAYGVAQAVANTVSGLVGGGAGMAYGAAETVGQGVQDLLSGKKPSLDLEQQMGKRAQQFTPHLPEALQTDTGREYTENTGRFLQENGPAVMGIGPELAMAGKAIRPAARGVGDALRSGADRVAEATTPTLEAGKQALAQKAIDAGIPINLHQLSGNKFVRMAGEASESLPLAGSKRAKRQSKFTQGVIKAIDSEAAHEKLTPEVFAEIQDKAGEEIGDISARTPVPHDALGDINAVARHDTPDVQGVVKAYTDDFKTVADANDGVIPGTELRKLRTEVQLRARTTSNGDLRNTLGNLVSKIDDALTEHAADGDMPALLDARRRYAISKAVEPLVAKSADGEISPAGLMGRVTADNAGKRRMARGNGGELGDYARIGQQFLKEQVSSGTAERNLLFGLAVDSVKAGKVALVYLPALAYNKLGPRAAKWIVERNAKRAEAGAEPTGALPEPSLEQGFEPPPTQRGQANPLGDLTPNWETTPGVNAGRGMPVEEPGLVRDIHDAELQPSVAPGRGVMGPPEDRAGLVPNRSAPPGSEIPAVPGRPDLPDVIHRSAGGEQPTQSEAAAHSAAEAGVARVDEANMSPGAVEARRQQRAAVPPEPIPVGEATEITPEVVEPAKAPPDPRLTEIDDLKAGTQSAAVRAVLGKREAALKKTIKAEQDAKDLRTAAEQTNNPEIKKALLAEAEKLAPTPKIPVGEATEIKPEVIEPKAPNESTEATPAAGGKSPQTSGPDNGPDGNATPAANSEKTAARGSSGPEAEVGGEHLSPGGFPEIDEGFMRAQERVREAARSAPPENAPAKVRKTLEDGAAAGTLDKDGVALALWALDRNPNLARGLKVELRDASTEAHGARGAYSNARDLVKLVQGNTDSLTATHEILHHAERMMPPAVQQGIRRAWQRSLKAEIANTSPLNPQRAAALREALDAMGEGDATAYSRMTGYFKDKTLTRADYRLVDPTEYWAENASEILRDRFTGRGSWRAEARQWLSDMIEHLKGVVGLRSDSAILKALDTILNPEVTTGERKSKNMITGSGKPKAAPTQPQAP
jgi:hypothetical protein